METIPPDDVFRALADPTRRAVLERLSEGPRSVGDLLESFTLSQPAMSQHLKVLREAGLVRVEAQGRTRLYALAPEGLEPVGRWLGHFERFWRAGLDGLGAYLDRRRT